MKDRLIEKNSSRLPNNENNYYFWSLTLEVTQWDRLLHWMCTEGAHFMANLKTRNDCTYQKLIQKHGFCMKTDLQTCLVCCITLQWNSHGYDIAKTFGSKLTSVSPVWLQLRRRGPETFDVTGLHDHDPGRGPTPLTVRWKMY